MLAGAIILIVVLVIVSVLVLTWPFIKRFRARKDFFSHAYHITYDLAKDRDYYLINDVRLAIDTKVIHFDHIIFGEKYIYCIGNMFSKGSLSGKFSDAQWRLYDDMGSMNYVKNPLLLHKTRVDYLKSAIKAEDLLIGYCLQILNPMVA